MYHDCGSFDHESAECPEFEDEGEEHVSLVLVPNAARSDLSGEMENHISDLVHANDLSLPTLLVRSCTP